uniref:Endonuclease, Uma2 family (Restriction endonuclease fold) n=1 Tax=Candidatus Kentrum sp. FW TaxID=2126338 RepID=A0A450TYE5_9GAMM|nr:MAG: Endonuclease, Uma2 family (restriction endonuclease fold) [Candidatus Kentron sp. FW]
MLPQHETKTTSQEYLALERASRVRHEFLDGEIFAMTGATRRHNRIAVNLVHMLSTQLAARPCGIYVSDMRVKIEAIEKYTYPDVVVACEQEIFEDTEEDTLLNPILIIEILSDSTEAYDRGDKFFHYRAIMSFAEYILVSQKKPYMERFTHQSDGSWLYSCFDDIHQKFESSSTGCTINLKEVYEKVSFSNP